MRRVSGLAYCVREIQISSSPFLWRLFSDYDKSFTSVFVAAGFHYDRIELNAENCLVFLLPNEEITWIFNAVFSLCFFRFVFSPSTGRLLGTARNSHSRSITTWTVRPNDDLSCSEFRVNSSFLTMATSRLDQTLNGLVCTNPIN